MSAADIRVSLWMSVTKEQTGGYVTAGTRSNIPMKYYFVCVTARGTVSLISSGKHGLCVEACVCERDFPLVSL